MPVSDMPADWAAQRVKNLDLRKAVINAILPKRNQTDITTLIEEFQYPKYGPGMMWEVCAEKVQAAGGTVRDAGAADRHHGRRRPRRRASPTTQGGTEHTVAGRRTSISTMPMRELVHTITPPPPAEVVAAADDLHYRDYLTVALVVPESRSFPDNWIYIHATDVEVGRIQNYGSWSPYLVKDGRTCLGLEYFVFEGDDMWNTPDDELIALGTKELVSLGLAADGDVERGYVVRVPKAYPYYDFSLQGERRDHPQVARGRGAQRPPGRAQRHAQVQQPGPLHVHRHADGGEHVRRRPRHLVGQRGGGVPRGGIDRTGRPRAAAAHGRHGGLTRPLAERRAHAGAAVAAVDDPRRRVEWCTSPWASPCGCTPGRRAPRPTPCAAAATRPCSCGSSSGRPPPSPTGRTPSTRPPCSTRAASTSWRRRRSPGLSLPLVPVTWIWGPVASLNVASTLAPALTAFTAFVVLRRWAPWTPAAFVGGLLYGFSPFVLTSLEFAHLMTAALMLLPLILAVLDEILIRQRHSAVGAGVLLGLLVVRPVLPLHRAAGHRGPRRRSSRWSVLVAAALVPDRAELRRLAPHAATRAWASASASGAVLLVWPVWFALDGPGAPLGSRLAQRPDRRGLHPVELRDARLPEPAHRLHRARRVRRGAAGLGGAISAGASSPCWRSASWSSGATAASGSSASCSCCVRRVLARRRDEAQWVPARLFDHVPVLENVIEQRFMAIGFLAAAVMLAVILDRRPPAGARTGAARLGALAAACVALVPVAATFVVAPALHHAARWSCPAGTPRWPPRCPPGGCCSRSRRRSRGSSPPWRGRR